MRMSINYKQHESMKGYRCFYCGEPAGTKDHYPPLAVRHLYPDHKRILIRACTGCNGYLSTSMQETLEERKLVARLRLNGGLNI